MQNSTKIVKLSATILVRSYSYRIYMSLSVVDRDAFWFMFIPFHGYEP